MKLSAPPPPPSQPEPLAPGSALVWPRWFTHADGILAALAVLLAFLLASFAARNSDVWLHLAAGRLIAEGAYSFGTDPFSYATAGRYWVNHAWLFDFVEYQIYTRFGAVALGMVKAISLAGAAAVLLAIRQRGQSLWPWVLVLTVALLAAAPRMLLAPNSASIVCLAILMWMLFRIPAPAGSWKLPVLVGVLCVVWSNLDEWFFLGPLTVAMLLLGSLIQTVLGARDEVDPGPAASTLAKALAIATLVCMINPHHIHVWRLPIEATGSSAMANEPLFQRFVLMGPLDSDYINKSIHGRNVNGAAYALLLAGGLAVLGFAVGLRLFRPGHILLWLAFAGLSLRTITAIPFFAVVSVPLLAWQLNVFTSRLAPSEARMRSWIFAGTMGRAVGAISLSILLIVAWPGWLHPAPDFESETPRVAWGIVVDPALRQTAEQIQTWRQSGALAPEEHGILLSNNLSNYCAWFAPSEKVFVNSRYTFHEPEFPTYTQLRSNIGTRTDTGTLPNAAQIENNLKQHGVSYVGLYEVGRPIGPMIARLARDEEHWTMWSLGGRSAVCGWRPSIREGRPSFTALRFDPAKLVAQGIAASRPASTESVLSPTALDDFFPEAATAPLEADESISWMNYKILTLEPQQQKQAAIQELRTCLLDVGGPLDPMKARLSIRSFPPPPVDFEALPLLALRAARQAIAARPEHPDGYYALFRAMIDEDLPISQVERRMTIVNALQECLQRCPRPDELPMKGLAFSPARIAASLGTFYRENSQLNLEAADPSFASIAGTPRIYSLGLARQALALAIQYAAAEMAELPGTDPMLEKESRDWAGLLKTIEDSLLKNNGQFEDFKARKPPIPVAYDEARKLGLMESAIALLKSANLKQEFKADWPIVALQQAAIELYFGHVQAAHDHLAALEAGLAAGEVIPQLQPSVRESAHKLEYMLAQVIGDYKSAAMLLDQEQTRKPPPPPRLQRAEFLLGGLQFGWPIPHAGPQNGLADAAMETFMQSMLDFEYSLRRRQDDVTSTFNRGMLALFDGNNAQARESFRKVKALSQGLPNSNAKKSAAVYLQILETEGK